MSVEYRHRIRVVHEYTPKVSPTKWGETVIKYNNEYEILGDEEFPQIPDSSSVESYLLTFFKRLDEPPHKYEYKGKYEGIYGYIWNDYRIEIVTEKITTTTKTILGQRKNNDHSN